MSETIISYRNVEKSFGSNRIYRDITLDIHRGETLCIIGGSGTGKSVMMKMLVGLLSPMPVRFKSLDNRSLDSNNTNG